jgi:cytochrome c553
VPEVWDAPGSKAYAKGAVAFFSLVLGLALAPTGASAQQKGDRAFGEYLATTCTTCHQITGRATQGVPPILAWPEDQFAAVMKSYRSGDRENQVMRAISSRLSDEEIYALAAYFGSLPLQPAIK